jgi:hypothetical protein
MVMCAGGMRFTGRVEILRGAMACCTAWKWCVYVFVLVDLGDMLCCVGVLG